PRPLSRSGAMLLRSNPRSRVAGDFRPRNGVQIPGYQRIQAAVLRLSTARSWIPDARADQGRTWSSRRRTSGAGDRRRWRRWLPTAGQLRTRTQSYPQGDEDQDAADLRAGNVRAGSAPYPPRRGPSGAGEELNADHGESQKAYRVDLDGMSRVVSSLYALLDDSAPIAATSMI